jgi:hypothetical protein
MGADGIASAATAAQAEAQVLDDAWKLLGQLGLKPPAKPPAAAEDAPPRPPPESAPDSAVSGQEENERTEVDAEAALRAVEEEDDIVDASVESIKVRAA